VFLIFAITGASEVRTWGKGECCSGFGKRVHQFITEKSIVTGDPLEA